MSIAAIRQLLEQQELEFLRSNLAFSQDKASHRCIHYCSVSPDGGMTFYDRRLTSTNWSPAHFTDLVLKESYMQDYDTVSPDWSGAASGFFAEFQFQNYGNPNVYGARF